MWPSISDGNENAYFNRPSALAVQGFVESLVTLSFATITTPFIAQNTPWYWNPFVVGSAILAANNLLRTQQVNSTDATFSFVNRTARGIIFCNFDLLYRAVLVHEIGHALTNTYFYPNANPQILITPPYGGITKSHIHIEQSLRIQALTAISGTVASMLWDTCTMSIGMALPKRHAELKSYLLVSANISVLSSAWYAVSAHWSCDLQGHDFCKLKEMGTITPIAAASLVVGSFILLQLGLMYLYSCISGQESKKSSAVHLGFFHTPKQSPSQVEEANDIRAGY